MMTIIMTMMMTIPIVLTLVGIVTAVSPVSAKAYAPNDRVSDHKRMEYNL